MPERSEWTDERIDDHMQALRALPAAVAKIAVQVDQCNAGNSELGRQVEKLGDECRERDRRVHGRIDQLNDRLSDRDREYRRNIVLALGPIGVVALLIAAKVVFGIEVPTP